MKTTTTAFLLLASLVQVAVSVPVSHKVHPSESEDWSDGTASELPPVPFEPENWSSETAPELFEYTNNVINAQQDFIHAIEGVVKSVASGNQLVFQSRPQPKTPTRFTAKFEEVLQRYKSKAAEDEEYATQKKKRWIDFSGVFGDFAAVRVTPHNGDVIDTSDIIQQITDKLKKDLPTKGYKEDKTWSFSVGRDNTMRRLFINLTPNAQEGEHVRVTMEIQVIHTVETAIAFTANSVAGHTNTDVGFPKMTKIKSSTLTKKNKKTGGEDSISLLDYMTSKDAAHVKNFPAALKENGFEVPDAFLDFYKEQKQKYRTYKDVLLE